MKYFETYDYKKRDEELNIIADKLNISADTLCDFFLDFSSTLNSKKCGYDVIIQSVNNNGGVIYSLRLNNCSTENTQIYVEWYELSQISEYEFRLEVADGESKVACFDFTEAVIETQAVNAFSDFPVVMNTTNYAQYYLCRASNNIVCHEKENLCNDCEKDVLPLARFMGDYSDEIPDAFWSLAEKHNITDLVNKYKGNKDKLFSKLFKPKYKDFLLEIYNILYDTQKGIPSSIQLFCKEDIFEKIQESVTSNFEKAGLKGEYPCYYNDNGFVYSFEDCCCDELITQYFCFQAEKLDKIPSFFEALLMANEYKKSSNMYKYNIVSPFFAFDDEAEKISIERIIEIAVKFINDDKRSKEEKKYCADNFYCSFILLFVVLCFLVCGVLFGLAMTVGFMLIEFVICMIVTGFNFSIFAEAFMKTPWWLIGIVSGVLFSLCMTIIQGIVHISSRFKN